MEEEMSNRRVREKRRQEKVAFMQALRDSINERKYDNEAEIKTEEKATKKPAKKSTKSTKKTGKK